MSVAIGDYKILVVGVKNEKGIEEICLVSERWSRMSAAGLPVVLYPNIKQKHRIETAVRQHEVPKNYVEYPYRLIRIFGWCPL